MRRLRGRLALIIAAASTTAGILVLLAAGATPAPPAATAATTGTTAPAPPTASTGSASDVRLSSAVLNGSVNPQGQLTRYYFQYGTSTAYGLQTSPASAGSGSGNVAAHSSITGLSGGTTYHYRLVAQNLGGTSYGADATFSTGPFQSQVRFMGRMGFVSPGRIIGVEAGCFGGESRCVGHVTMSHDGTVIGQGGFDIAPDTGGFQNIQISSQGEGMLQAYNGQFHLLPVTVQVSTTSGQTTSQVMHLARWFWH